MKELEGKRKGMMKKKEEENEGMRGVEDGGWMRHLKMRQLVDGYIYM